MAREDRRRIVFAMHSLTSSQRAVLDIYERPVFRARVSPRFPVGKLVLAKRGVVFPRPPNGAALLPPWPFRRTP